MSKNLKSYEEIRIIAEENIFQNNNQKSNKKFRPVSKKSRRTRFFTNFVCALLIISLLTVSTPAAPQTIVGEVSEFSQDVRFSLLSSRLAIDAPNWFAFLFSISGGTSQPTPTVTRIEILPGAVTVKQGEQIAFTAIGYDEQNAPVAGIDFDWQVADTGRGLSARPLQNGVFKTRSTGTYTVTALGAGLQAQTSVTVTPSPATNPNQPGFQEAPPINISSRSTQITKEKQKPESEQKEKTEIAEKETNENGQNLLPEDGGWNNGNWGSSDDPGNLPGNPPGSPADDGASNSNFQLSAPVISLPGRGIDLALNLHYNSRLWNKSGNELTYDIDHGFPAPGWSLGFGKIVDMGANGGSLLIDADGTRHGYSGTIFPGYGGSSTFRGYTVDGKFIDYYSFRDNTGILWAQAYFPNGTTIYYGAKNDGAVYPTTIRDAQGNYITITYRNNQGPAIDTVTDTLGRVVTFNYDSSTPARLISVTAPRMRGESNIYGTDRIRTVLMLHYKPLTLNYSFAAGITPMVRNGTPQVIDAIYYPGTQTGYWFNDTDSYSSYGMLTKVVEQRGMSWSASAEEQGTVTAGQMSKKAVYNYPLTTANEANRTDGVGLTNAPSYTTLAESWDGRDVNEDAVTTYAFDNNTYRWDGFSNSPARLVTVTQPNGAISKQYSYRTPNAWTDGLVFADETIVMNGTTPTTVSSSLVSWQQGDYQTARPSWAQITDENGKKVKTEYSYAGGLFNQITRSCDYDDGGAKLRCTNAVYENSQAYKGTWYWYGTGGGGGVWYFGGGRHIFNLVKMTTVENPDGTIASRTDYEYDNYQNNALVNTPGVIQHDATHDPFTTQTTWVEGECGEWAEHPYGGQYCVWYQQYEVSVYDPATEKRGNLTKTTTYADAQNLTGAIYETRSYDITGNLRTASTACCEQTSIDYSSSYQYAYPTSQTRGSADVNSPHRITTGTVYNAQTGLTKQQTDANGRISIIYYNPNTLRPTQSTSSTGAYSAFAYDDTAMTVTEEVRESNGNPAGKTVKYLNGLGLTKREESLGANNVWDIVEVKYNKYAEEWKLSRPYRAGDTVQWTERFYDLQGRLFKVVEPDGSETKAFYNETPRPDSVLNVPGQTTRVVDAWGRERWGRYDQQGRLVEVVEPNPNRTANPTGSVFAAGSMATKYKYDTLGRLIETDQNNQLRKFKYDDLGRMTRQKLAEQTKTLNDAGQYVGANNAAANWSEAFWYDSRSNLVMKTDPRGVKTHLSYQISGADDPLNRLQSRIYDLSGPLDPNLTIHAAPTVTYSYMTTGDKTRLNQIRTDGLLTENFSYDIEGRVSDYTQTVDYRSSYPMTTSYLYDTLDRVTDVRYPAQYGLAGSPRKLIQNSFDVASRLSSFKVDGTEVAGNIVYNASDQTTSIKIGAAGANQMTEEYTFDPQTGLLTNQKAKKGAQTLLDLSYDYNRSNAVGSLSGKTGHLTKIINNLDNNKNREYEFDALGRLTKAKGGATGNLWQQNYEYDRYGNRTNVTASGVAADNSPIPLDGEPGLAYHADSNRISTTGYQYDSAGNQTRAKAENGGWILMEYDAANRLVTVKADGQTPTPLQGFAYGSTNARLFSYDNAAAQLTIFASVNGQTLAEYKEFTHTVPTWTKTNVYLGDSQLSTVTPNGAGGEITEYNHPDRLGTRLTTNQQTGTSYEQAHLPFGKALNAESSGATGKRFTSYERSTATGLDYAVNRTYDSKQGRFTQVDPIKMRAVSFAAPQTLNLYNYCGNDPINHTDPNGLFWGFFKKLFKWALVAIAVVIAVMTIVAAPATILGVLGAISAGAGAASQVLNALGYKKAGMIFGLIAMITGFGSVIADKMGVGNFVEGSSQNDLSGAWFGIFSGVGAIVNNFSAKKKSRRQTAEQKRWAIVEQTVFRVISRLKSNSECLKTINQGNYDLSPDATIKEIFDRGNLPFNKNIQVPAQTVPFQTNDGVIDLGSSFFKDKIKDGRGNDWNKITGLNKHRTREFIILHELRHLHGATHDNEEGLKEDITKILKDCFGVTPNFGGGIK